MMTKPLGFVVLRSSSLFVRDDMVMIAIIKVQLRFTPQKVGELQGCGLRNERPGEMLRENIEKAAKM